MEGKRFIFIEGVSETDWKKLDKLAAEKYGTKKNFLIQKIRQEII